MTHLKTFSGPWSFIRSGARFYSLRRVRPLRCLLVRLPALLFLPWTRLTAFHGFSPFLQPSSFNVYPSRRARHFCHFLLFSSQVFGRSFQWFFLLFFVCDYVYRIPLSTNFLVSFAHKRRFFSLPPHFEVCLPSPSIFHVRSL